MSHPRAMLAGLALLVVARLAPAQSTPAAQQAPAEWRSDTATITRIRALFKSTERELPKLRRETRDLLGYSAENGDLTAWFADSTLRKLRATLYGESGREVLDLYFDGGELAFVYRVAMYYDQPMSSKIVARVEERVYYDRERMIRALRTPRKRSEREGSYTGPENYRKLGAEFAACAKAAVAETAACKAR